MRHEKIEYKSIEDLIPYARNQRIHSDEQVKRIAASIKEFGFKNPVIVDKEGTIIAGHGRCLAAEKLKIKELPVIVADDLNASQVKALRLADNKLQDLSEFDDELVKLELEELKGLDFDINLTGFDDLIDINSLDELDDERLDEVPEAPKEPRTKQGDLYIIDGKHRVLCGDSTKEEDVKRLMGGEKADMVLTDPPYGLNYSTINSPEFHKVNNDDKIPDLSYLWTYSTVNCEKYIWCDWRKYHIVRQQIIKNGQEPKAVIVWNKAGGNERPRLAHVFMKWGFCHEWLIFIGKQGGERYMYADVLNAPRELPDKVHHATAKPVSILTKALEVSSRTRQIVLDLFLGSGSTLIACEKTNRKCYGMEIDPTYCDVIIQRYKDLKPEAKIELNGEAIDW